MTTIRPSKTERIAQQTINRHQNAALVQPATFVPTGTYTGNNMGSSREGANDKTHASLPMSAQIEVRSV